MPLSAHLAAPPAVDTRLGEETTSKIDAPKANDIIPIATTWTAIHSAGSLVKRLSHLRESNVINV